MTKKHSVFLYFDEKTSEDPLNLIVTDTANYQTRQVIFSLQKLQALADCSSMQRPVGNFTICTFTPN